MVSNDCSVEAADIFDYQLTTIQVRTDHMFVILFALQWIFAILCAVYVSPSTSVGDRSQLHPEMCIAVVVGGLLTVGPVSLALARPGCVSTRMTVAVAQMLYSALLFHLTGGRIETQIHVFGSLAILAFYRDWRVFVPATLTIGLDLLIRGIFWPASAFGVLAATPWRGIEHAGWILFEDIFLIWGCVAAERDMRHMATTSAAAENAMDERAHELLDRTKALEVEMARNRTLEAQLLQAQKLESVGQLAAGIAHEINTPMQFVHDNIEFLSECSSKLFEVVHVYQRNLNVTGPHRSWQERCAEVRHVTEQTHFERVQIEVPKAIQESLDGIQRVINIVRAMKEFSHPGQDEKVGVDLNNAVRSTVTIARNRWKYAAEMILDLDPDLPTLRCVPAEINQVLLNLIVNASDAIVEKVGDNGEQRGAITIRTLSMDGSVAIEVEDTGNGIPDDVRNRIFDPFFTTKDVGKGTGQGLAICYNVIVNKHHGAIDVESTLGVGSRFRISIPWVQSEDTKDSAVNVPAESTTAEIRGDLAMT